MDRAFEGPETKGESSEQIEAAVNSVSKMGVGAGIMFVVIEYFEFTTEGTKLALTILDSSKVPVPETTSK